MELEKAVTVFENILSGYKGFWCVAGGWAIDIYLNRKTREHEDFEIIVLRNEIDSLRAHFTRFHPQKIFSGSSPRFMPWDGNPFESEVIQLRIDPVEDCEFDLLLTPSLDDEWICRRDESIRLPLKKIVYKSECGLSVLKPEIVLLFKAKYLREKDCADYSNSLPTLNADSMDWLKESLEKIHPGHPWINPRLNT
jgi:hypothetical protein